MILPWLDVDHCTVLATQDRISPTVLKLTIYINVEEAIDEDSQKSLYVFVEIGQRLNQIINEVFVRLHQSYLIMKKEHDEFIREQCFKNQSGWNDENHYFNFCFYDIYYKFSEYFHITLSENEHTKNLTWNQISLHDRVSLLVLSRDDLRIHFYDLQYLDFDRLRVQRYDLKKALHLEELLSSYHEPKIVENYQCSN